MTTKERIMQIVNNIHTDMEADTMEKLICVAYWIGRESATKETSDKYNALIATQNERAEKSRYKHFAKSIIGDQKYIYCSDYAGEMTSIFGNDITNL